MVFILLFGFGDYFRFRACPCLLWQESLSRNMKAELKPFLTIFGTGMRAENDQNRDKSRCAPSCFEVFYVSSKLVRALKMSLARGNILARKGNKGSLYS